MPKDGDKIIRGEWGIVDYVTRKNGSQPAKNDLEKIKKNDPRNYRRLIVLLMRLAELGSRKLSGSVFGKLDGKIFELKRHPYRIGCFFIGNMCLLTHVFDKKKGAAFVSKEIDKAKRIMKEHCKR